MAHSDARKMIDTANRAPVELAQMTDKITPTKDASGERRCPECRQTLVRETIGNVEIDVCDDHGTWFDPRELEQVAVILLRDHGPAARRAARAAEQGTEAPAVSLQNVAIGVASLTLGLIGAMAGAPGLERDVFGREIPRDD
jgi:Zn-finger nucleic acid-binding protein